MISDGIAQYRSVVDLHVELMKLARKHLPIHDASPSRLRYLLLLVLAQSEAAQSRITVKTLFAAVPYSDAAVRKHFDKLLSENWVFLENDPTDRRIRYIRPTEKLTACLTNWLFSCDNLFKTEMLNN